MKREQEKFRRERKYSNKAYLQKKQKRAMLYPVFANNVQKADLFRCLSAFLQYFQFYFRGI